MALQSKSGAALVALALGLSSAGCIRAHGHGHGGSGGHGGVYSFTELEPNDFAPAANYFGYLAVGETLIVRGYIDDSGYDPFDGFAFTTAEVMDVQVYLTSDDPYADLDLCYYNPYTGLLEACWETSYNPETGLLALYGGRDFHLVVASYYGASTYTLEVVGLPPGYGPAAAPAGGPSEASSEDPDGARARAVPFEAYGGDEDPQPGASAPAEPRVRGRLIAFDLRDGSVATRDIELDAQGRWQDAPARRP